MLLINPKRLTASRLDLASHCLCWARTDTELPDDEPFDYTTKGALFHDAAEQYLVHGEADVVALGKKGGHDIKIVEAVTEMFLGWVESWALQEVALGGVEIAYAYDVSDGTARALPFEWWKRRGERGPTDMVAKVDVFGWRDGMLVVVDHKTGQRRGAAADSRQLMLGALCIARDLGEETVCVEYHYVDAEGNIDVDSAVLTEMELGGLEAELRGFVKVTEAPPRPGTHCSELFCKANEMNTCPATRENTEQLVPADRLPKGLTNDDDARAWILLLPAVKAATKKAEAALKKYVGDRQLELGDGRVYSAKEVHRNGGSYVVKASAYMDYRIRGRKSK